MTHEQTEAPPATDAGDAKLISDLREAALNWVPDGVSAAHHICWIAADRLSALSRAPAEALKECCDQLLKVCTERDLMGDSQAAAIKQANAILSSAPSVTASHASREGDPPVTVDCGELAILRATVERQRTALERYLAAVLCLARVKNGKTLFELSPLYDDECLAAWKELDAAGKNARAALTPATAQPVGNAGDGR